MYQIRILNDKEVEEFNKRFNTDYQVIHIKQCNKKYYAYVDCNKKYELKQKEAQNYFI